MANALTEELINDVLEVIDEIGFTADFKVFTGGTYDAAEREFTTPATETDFVSVPCSTPEAPNERWFPPTMIKEGDTQIILPIKNITFIPKPGTEVTFDSEVWKTENVEKIKAQETIAYLLLLRR